MVLGSMRFDRPFQVGPHRVLSPRVYLRLLSQNKDSQHLRGSMVLTHNPISHEIDLVLNVSGSRFTGEHALPVPRKDVVHEQHPSTGEQPGSTGVNLESGETELLVLKNPPARP